MEEARALARKHGFRVPDPLLEREQREFLRRTRHLEGVVRAQARRSARHPDYFTVLEMPFGDGGSVRWQYWPFTGRRQVLTATLTSEAP